MRLRLILFCLISAIAWGPTRSWAGLPKENRTLAGYVLTYEEFLKLSIEQKVAYYKFLIQFLGHLEEIQEGPTKSKTAALKLQLLQILPEAHAEDTYVKDESILGKTCIFGMEASVYYKSPTSGQYRCKPVFGTSDCGSGQIACPDKLRDITQAANSAATSLCVDGPASRNDKGFTRRCYEQLQSTIPGLKLDQSIADQAVKFSTDDKAKYEGFVAQMKAHLVELQDRRMGSSTITLREYCALGKNAKDRGKNKMNQGLQEEECKTLLTLVDSFDVAMSDPSTETPAPASTEPDAAAPAVTDAPAAEPAEEESAPPTPAPPVAPVRDEPEEEKVAKTESEQTEEAAPPAEPPAIEKKTPPRPKTKPAPAQDCLSRHQAKLGPLACVACGLEKATDSKKTTFNNYIALLGAVAQKHGSYNVETSSGRGQLQARVIEMIGSYGYCSDSEYQIRIEDENIRDWIDGQSTRGSYNKVFKIEGDFLFSRQIDNLFSKDDFRGKTNLYQRHSRFRSEAKQYAGTYSSAFAKCAKHIVKRLETQPRFDFRCTNKGLTKAATIQSNNKFRKAIAQACRVSVTTEEVSSCGKQCHRPTGYLPCDYNSKMNCCESRDRGSKGGGDRRDPPKGEPREHESHRDRNTGPEEGGSSRPEGGGADGNIRGSQGTD